MFSVSTIPRTGFIARLAIPVLKFLEAMSKIAVPVVSEPVPAVVGTIEKVSPDAGDERQGRLTCDQRPKLFGDWQALA